MNNTKGTDYTNLTDSELTRRVQVMEVLTPLERELAARLERALDEVDALTQEMQRVDDARRASEVRHQAVANGQGNLVLLPRQ